MARRSVLVLGLAAAVLLGVSSVTAWARYYGPRQYYGSYRYHSTYRYYYRPYYYKPRANYYGYKHHYAVYYPSRPKYIYYYNPYKKAYWGRCPSQSNGKPAYSLLKEADRKPNLEDIDESAFPPMGEMPPIPESDDGDRLELPPDDLPTAKDEPVGPTTGRGKRAKG